MEVFSQIDDALAIVKYPRGILKQVKMYRRKDRVYVPHSGGFIEVRNNWDGAFTTSHPDVKVVEYDARGTHLVKEMGSDHLRWR